MATSTDEPRIALFDDWWPLHVGTEKIVLTEDRPGVWAEGLDHPEFEMTGEFDGEKFYVVSDERAVQEVHRLTQFRTCAICRSAMDQVSEIEDEVLLLCPDCGYWGGRGFRDHNFHMHAVPMRGVIARYQPLADLDAASTDYLVSHLRRFPRTMTRMSPFRAETFVADLLKDYLDCDVHPLGGRKDGGVDAFILSNDVIRTIVQVKWRESTTGAERVSTVREVGGTLLARGVPKGIIVSTKDRFSADAKREAEAISSRSVGGLGKLDLSLFDYHRILDMLAISNARLEDRWKPADLDDLHTRYCVFDGAMKIPEWSVPSSRRS